MIDSEVWEVIKEENRYTDNVIQNEDFLVDFSFSEFQRLQKNGFRLEYNQFLELQRKTGNNYRKALAKAYYCGNFMEIKGHIFLVDCGRILLKDVVVMCFREDGSYFDGFEDHVWVEKRLFRKIQPRLGGNVSFYANVYRYIKETKDGLRIDFGVKDVDQVCRIGTYNIPKTYIRDENIEYMHV